MTLPLGALILGGLWLATRQGRQSGGERPGLGGRRDIEWPGALLLGAGLGLAVLALYPDDPARSAVNANALPFGIAAAAALAAFAWRQGRRLSPLIGRDLLRRRPFAGSMVANL